MQFLRKSLILIGLLTVVGAVILLKRNIRDIENAKQPTSWLERLLLFLVGSYIGVYEGFFGPGTGLIVAFTLVMWLGFSYVQASGSAQVISLSENVVAFCNLCFSW